jgi:zinc protease
MLADWQVRGDWRLIGPYLDQLAAATPDDLRRVAERYLRPESGSVLVYRPAGAPALSPDDASLSGRTKRLATNGAPEPAPANARPPAAVSIPRMSPDSVEDGVHFYTTPTGIPIVIKPRAGVGLLSISLAVPGGALDEIEETAGITSLMTRVSLKGTANRSAAVHATEVESLGGSIHPAVRGDWFDWTLKIPVRHVERGMDLLLDVALEPTFPEPELERERKVALSDLEQVLDDMYRYPLRLFMEAAFPDHAYGLGIDTVEAAMRAVTRDDIARWHQRHLLDGEPWVFAVGDVDPDATALLIARRLGGLGRGARVDSAVPPAWPPSGAVNVATRDKRQTAMVVGFPGPARNDPDTYRLDLLANVIGGLGGRLFEELRSRRSLAYAVSVHTIARFAGGAFLGYIATSPDREEEARAGLLEELVEVTRTPLFEDEVERAKRYMLGTWRIRMQTNAAQLAELSSALLLGDGLRELREYEDRLMAIGPDEIRAAAAARFTPGTEVLGIVRGTGGGR